MRIYRRRVTNPPASGVLDAVHVERGRFACAMSRLSLVVGADKFWSNRL
jgi:hypothetical protein